VQGKLCCASTGLQFVDGPLRFTGLCGTPVTRKHVQAHTEASNHAVRNAGITQFGLISSQHGIQTLSRLLQLTGSVLSFRRLLKRPCEL